MNRNRSDILKNVSRVVIKAGSRLLVDMEKGGVNQPMIKALTRSIVQLRRRGIDVVLVSSGAVGAGMALLGISERPSKLENVQSCASVGQIKLMSIYEEYFSIEGFHVGQVLLSAEDFRIRDRYINISNTIHSMLKHSIIPIINENDSVTIKEIKVGDNDKLSADVTQFLETDLLIILTDEDGLFDKNPKEHDDATLISVVEKVTPAIKALAGKAGSNISTGGMKSKLKAIKQASAAGSTVILANGFTASIEDILAGENIGTLFIASKTKITQKKKWLSYVSEPVGRLYVDAGGINALENKNSSLLSVGVQKTDGSFQKGDLVEVCTSSGTVIARGITNFNNDEILSLIGKKTEEVTKL
ncbi:MAG: glutamate 5-kinase, partial [Fibrobacterales bacterium]